MTPFLANLLVGAILALVGWSIAFGIWVVKENSARKDDFHKLDKLSMSSDIVILAIHF